MPRDDGGPAFPVGCDSRYCDKLGEGLGGFPGMTLRDWFAGQALGGLLAGITGIDPSVTKGDHFARLAYGLADAMLAEREKNDDE